MNKKVTNKKPRVFGVLNQKGGSGKTTISLHLASALSNKGHKVLLIDGDPQGSARDWLSARVEDCPFGLVGLDRPIIHKELPKLASEYDYVVIDGAPRVTDLTRSAILASDLVLIPIQPSPLDIWASNEILDLVKEASIYKPSIESAIVISRKIINTNIGDETINLLKEHQLPILDSIIHQRIVYAECLKDGRTALETGSNQTATKEIEQFAAELLKTCI
ncbi:AAA family ATPase [Pleurocapsales cyanobacterium LEGE 10410]|nr:AAA family ATPase [Pleurocapsales cyanobacterium LEGE 10410]